MQVIDERVQVWNRRNARSWSACAGDCDCTPPSRKTHPHAVDGSRGGREGPPGVMTGGQGDKGRSTPGWNSGRSGSHGRTLAAQGVVVVRPLWPWPKLQAQPPRPGTVSPQPCVWPRYGLKRTQELDSGLRREFPLDSVQRRESPLHEEGSRLWTRKGVRHDGKRFWKDSHLRMGYWTGGHFRMGPLTGGHLRMGLLTGGWMEYK